jgi:hypothetical protein
MEIEDCTAKVQCPKCGFQMELAKIFGPRLAKLEVLWLIVREMDGKATMPRPIAEKLASIMEQLEPGS